jgi:hypothetical protein
MISNPTSVRIFDPDPLRIEYRKLLQLRERVREAEAAAALKAIRRRLLAEDWVEATGSRRANVAPLTRTNTTPSPGSSPDASGS